MANQEQLDSFYRFATAQLTDGASEKSIDDMNNGDMGRDAGEVERELREELKLPTPE